MFSGIHRIFHRCYAQNFAARKYPFNPQCRSCLIWKNTQGVSAISHSIWRQLVSQHAHFVASSFKRETLAREKKRGRTIRCSFDEIRPSCCEYVSGRDSACDVRNLLHAEIISAAVRRRQSSSPAERPTFNFALETPTWSVSSLHLLLTLSLVRYFRKGYTGHRKEKYVRRNSSAINQRNKKDACKALCTL